LEQRIGTGVYVLMVNYITPEYNYECMHEQHRAILLGVKTITKEGMTDEQLHYYRGIDVCSTYQHTADKYILLVLLGDKGIPFALIQDYDEPRLQFYKEHKNTMFYIDVIHKQTPLITKRKQNETNNNTTTGTSRLF